MPIPQLTGMQDPLFKKKARLMQALHDPLTRTAEHSSGMQVALLKRRVPMGQTGGLTGAVLALTHEPLTAVLALSRQVKQTPESGSNVLQEESALMQVPLRKYCLIPQP